MSMDSSLLFKSLDTANLIESLRSQPSKKSSVSPPNGDRKRGRVKFFDSVKGYGFIIPSDPNERNSCGKNEIFVHHTGILNYQGGFKSLAEGEMVDYDLVEGPNGLQASNVSGPDGSDVLGDPAAPMLWKTSNEAAALAKLPVAGDLSMYYPEQLLNYLYVIGILSPSEQKVLLARCQSAKADPLPTPPKTPVFSPMEAFPSANNSFKSSRLFDEPIDAFKSRSIEKSRIASRSNDLPSTDIFGFQSMGEELVKHILD